MSVDPLPLVTLWRQFRRGSRRALFVLGIRVLAACVWIVFGIGFKLLDMVPRHTDIVATILGDDLARPATVVIGLLEAALGLWVLSGVRPRLCASVQTFALVSMSSLELLHARHLLLAPVFMVCANAIFLALVWSATLIPIEDASP